MLVLSGSFAVLLTAAFLILILAIRAQRSAGDLALRSQEAVTAGETLEKNVLNFDNGLRGFVATGREKSLRPFVTARRAYPGQLAALERLVGDDAGERALLRQIVSQTQDYLNLWALPLIAIVREDQRGLDKARSIMGNTIGRDRIDGIREQFAALFARERAVAATRQASARSRSTRAVLLGAGGILLVLALTLVGVLYLRRAVVRPVTTVAGATQAVAAGDLSTRVPVTREDEIGTLARGFNAMTHSLERGHAQLEERTAELERTNRDLEDFASVASHDLQGPLATIVMFAESLGNRLVKRDDLDDAKLAEHIGTAAGDLRTLVRDLLAYSRLGRRALDVRPVDLDEVVRRTLDILAAPIEDAGAQVVAEPLPVVNGDFGRLCQVMQNLISNAVKFSVRGGDAPLVRISSERDEGQWRISVTDNGIGFDPDEAHRIFRPFHRLHSTDAYDGSGIGLAICERIVTQHGGRIWADSRKGAGATFHVELPAGPVAAEATEPQPALA